jgi:hypothetical protein
MDAIAKATRRRNFYITFSVAWFVLGVLRLIYSSTDSLSIIFNVCHFCLALAWGALAIWQDQKIICLLMDPKNYDAEVRVEHQIEHRFKGRIEDRLDELERLKRRDMVTPEEYTAKRQEILKDL